MAQTPYEIRVAGVVPKEDLEDMGAVTLSPDTVSTVLYGVSDQAALYGLLDRLRALGLDIIEVRRIPDVTGSGSALGEERDDDPAATTDGPGHD